MSWAAPSSERQEIPAAVEAVLRRRTSAEKLYWRLKRPRAGVYVRTAGRVLRYRAAAAVTAIIAITMCAFLGMVAGTIGTPRWPPLARIGIGTVSLAVTHAVTEFAAWMPAFIVLGLILVSIPRPRRWIFGLTLLGGAALGYCQRRLPPLPRSSIAAAITERVAALAARLPLRPPPSSTGTASVVLVAAAVAGYVCYRYSYGLAVRSTDLIPRRPVSHYRSPFAAVRAPRRLAAVPVVAALLLAGAWIVTSIRAPLPGVRYQAFLFGYSHPSVVAWALAALIVAWVVCMPYPQGFRWLLIVLLFGLAAYAFAPRVYLIRMPAAIPAAGPGSFWALAIAYLAVTGFGYSLVATVLDWPR